MTGKEAWVWSFAFLNLNERGLMNSEEHFSEFGDVKLCMNCAVTVVETFPFHLFRKMVLDRTLLSFLVKDF